ncbi:MAG: hypothetical protein RL343_270 [Actinomycetota bacterium]|jgi:hypothetical protein
MPSSVYATNRIPSHYVTQSLRNLQVAVWANPRLIVISIGTNAGLGGVLHASLYFSPANTHACGRKI